jgi:hypothetical protein
MAFVVSQLKFAKQLNTEPLKLQRPEFSYANLIY